MEFQALPSGLKEVLSEEGGLDVRVYYLECMAQATYVVSHEGKAVIIDPRRDVDSFLADLKARNLSLAGILETHFHADFVSGHYELMQRTGATIYFGPSASARCKFPHHELKDNEVIDFTSSYEFRTLHTPGHTPESVVYLLVDKTRNKPLKAFTGDTLFIGSCGRPDLIGSIGCTAEQMSRLMFNTLRNKICTLPDDVQVFPAHGAGSPCGKNLSSDAYSTIGKEKLTNPALQYTNEDEFVKFLTEGQPTAPQYFPYNVQLNISGAQPVAEDLAHVLSVSPGEFKSIMDTGSCTVIDTRNPMDFCACHVVGALNFPLGGEGGVIVGPEDGNFAIWVGTLIPSDSQLLLLVNDADKDGEALQRLARIGYTKVKAVLVGGMANYQAAGYPVETSSRVDLKSGPSLDSLLSSGNKLIDVRTEGEYLSNSAKGALNLPLATLRSHLDELEKDKSYIAFCTAGYRSAIAASILRRSGFKVLDVVGGFAAISVYAPEHTTTGVVCPTMKSLIEAMGRH